MGFMVFHNSKIVVHLITHKLYINAAHMHNLYSLQPQIVCSRCHILTTVGNLKAEVFDDENTE